MDIANCPGLTFLKYTAVQVSPGQLDLENQVNPAEERKPTTSAISHTSCWELGLVPARCRATSFLNHVSYRLPIYSSPPWGSSI